MGGGRGQHVLLSDLAESQPERIHEEKCIYCADNSRVIDVERARKTVPLGFGGFLRARLENYRLAVSLHVGFMRLLWMRHSGINK